MHKTLTLLIAGTLLLCVGCSKAPRQTRNPLESPSAYEFKTWKGPLTGKAAEELHKRQDKDFFGKNHDNKRTYIIKKFGRDYQITEYLIQGEPYEIKVEGGAWSFSDPLEKLKNQDVKEIFYGNHYPKGYKVTYVKNYDPKKEKRITLRDKSKINKILNIIRHGSYRKKYATAYRPSLSPDGKTLYGTRGGRGYRRAIRPQIYRGIHIMLKNRRVISVIIHRGGSVQILKNEITGDGIFYYNDLINDSIKDIPAASEIRAHH